MADRYHENRNLRELIRKLLELETGEDSMICHDGGFRYSGDFMSMESGVVEPASLISADERRLLLDHGYVETIPGGIRVTDAGRELAFSEDSLK